MCAGCMCVSVCALWICVCVDRVYVCVCVCVCVCVRVHVVCMCMLGSLCHVCVFVLHGCMTCVIDYRCRKSLLVV